MNTSSKQKERINAAIDGRGQNAAYTGGARTSRTYKDKGLYAVPEQEVQRRAWANNTTVDTYTSTPGGKLSANGRNTKDAYTNTFTPKNDDGTPVVDKKTGRVRQSGRSEKASRSQRNYDVRSGMNNISARTVQAWIDNGMATVSNGTITGSGGMLIRQKANGNYSMGLSVG